VTFQLVSVVNSDYYAGKKGSLCKENAVIVREGVRYVRTQPSCVLFIMLMTTCYGHCGPSSGHKNVYSTPSLIAYNTTRMMHLKTLII
jgi:hypothetical protein